MACARSASRVVELLLLLIAGTVHGADAKSPRTDLYGDPLPPGAVARLGTVQLRHANSLFTFSADGKQLISFDPNGEIRVWDVATGRLARSRWLWRTKQEFRHDADATRDWHILRYSIALAPDGMTAAARREDGIYLYDTAIGELRRRLPINSPDKNESLRFSLSTDGKLLTVIRQPEGKAAVSIQLWDVITGKLRQSFKLSIPNLRLIAFSSDGKYVLGELKEVSEIHVWDTSTGKEVDRFKISSSVWPVFSPDGKTLAAALSAGLKVRIWDTSNRKEKTVLELSSDLGKECSFYALAFSQDGRFLAGAYANPSANSLKISVVVWDAVEQREVRHLTERGVLYLALAPDGKTLACSSWDNEIRLWNLTTGHPLHCRPGHSSPVQTVAASPDGRVLASGATRVRLWDIATSRQLHVFEHGWREVVVATDGIRVVSATQLQSNQDSVRVWDIANGKEVRQFLITRPPFSTDFSRIEAIGLSSDGKHVTAVAFNSPPLATNVYHWRIDTGELLSKRSYPRAENSPNILASIAPDGENLCLIRQGKVCMETASSGRLLQTLPQPVGGSVVFSPDSRLVAATNQLPRKKASEGFDWKGLSLIEAATGKEVLSWQTQETYLFAFTRDGRGLVSVDKRALRVWDTATGKQLHQMKWPAGILEQQEEFVPRVRSLALLPGGRAATGLYDGTILIWDLAAKTWPSNGLARELTAGELKKLWADLAGEPAPTHRALYTLAASPSASLPFLRSQFLPAAIAEAKRIEKLLAHLDSDSFQEREAAMRELIPLREWMEPTLRRMLENKPNAEVRRRLQAILTAKAPVAPMSIERLRTMRAIAVLELIGTPEARRMLEKLACGAASPEARTAQAALQRLKHQAESAKEGAAP